MKNLKNKLTLSAFVATMALASIGNAHADYVGVTYESGMKVVTYYDDNGNVMYTRKFAVRTQP